MVNKGYTYREIIGRRDEGLTLPGYLAGRYRHSSEGEWRDRIEEGRVLVDGREARPGERLKCGLEVAWLRPPWEEAAVPLCFQVLHEDDALLAVAKPSGLPTLPGGGYLEHTLLALVRRRFPGVSPVHRLGRATSGVVLFARTPKAGRALAEAFRKRRVEKLYLGVVEGEPREDYFTVEVSIGPVAHPLLGSVHAANPGGKAALSRVRVIERREGASLVEVSIETGRPHQIRIHMAACGHPLIGDRLYAKGGGLLPTIALPGECGYLLHAWKIAMKHPESGDRVEVCCEPPEGFALFLRAGVQTPAAGV